MPGTKNSRDSLRSITEDEIAEFHELNNLYILFDKTKYERKENPDISVVITVRNQAHCIGKAIRSVQNQSLKNIEIIIVDDCSLDNSTETIEQYMKEDDRIRLIKNIENRKILYSKSFSVLNSKGKYIILLDQDDIFIRDDVFDMLYNEAEKEDLDLVHIRDICKYNLIFNNLTRVNYPERHLIFPKRTHYKKQPELKDKMYKDQNYLLWGLLIKSDIYKKAIYHLWPLITNYKITFHEDYSITFMLIILSQKYKFLNNFALLHLYHLNSTSQGYVHNDNYYLSVLFCGNTLFDYHINDNPKDIKIFINFYNLFKDHFNKGKKLFPNLFNFIMNKVINNKYLTNKQKEYFQQQIIFKENISEHIENMEYEAIYNYQNTNFNKNTLSYINEPKISIIIYCTEHKYLEKNNKFNTKTKFHWL